MYSNIILNLSTKLAKITLMQTKEQCGHELSIYNLIVMLILGLYWFSIYEQHSITIH